MAPCYSRLFQVMIYYCLWMSNTYTAYLPHATVWVNLSQPSLPSYAMFLLKDHTRPLHIYSNQAPSVCMCVCVCVSSRKWQHATWPRCTHARLTSHRKCGEESDPVQPHVHIWTCLRLYNTSTPSETLTLAKWRWRNTAVNSRNCSRRHTPRSWQQGSYMSVTGLMFC